jgi:hypothetical protein
LWGFCRFSGLIGKHREFFPNITLFAQVFRTC